MHLFPLLPLSFLRSAVPSVSVRNECGVANARKSDDLTLDALDNPGPSSVGFLLMRQSTLEYLKN